MKLATAPDSLDWLRIAAAVCCLMFAGVAMWALLDLSDHSNDLVAQINSHMALSGAESQVTSVLLNFRGYDTLLEVTVLLLAVISVWALDNESRQSVVRHWPNAVMIATIVRIIFPLIIMTAGYLVWVGGHRPGGAFQAGTLLAAIGILLELAGKINALRAQAPYWLRFGIAFGLVIFLAVAISCGISGHFLQYPQKYAGWLLLTIETTLTLSIAMILAMLFLGTPSIAISNNKEEKA